jgi:hypothetical protein
LRQRKLSISTFLIQVLGLGLIIKVFLWVIGSKVFDNESIHIPWLDYGLIVVVLLLVIRIIYVLVKTGLRSKRASMKDETTTEIQTVPATCVVCNKQVSERVEEYCKQHSNRFGGQVYCYDHQLGK